MDGGAVHASDSFEQPWFALPACVDVRFGGPSGPQCITNPDNAMDEAQGGPVVRSEGMRISQPWGLSSGLTAAGSTLGFGYAGHGAADMGPFTCSTLCAAAQPTGGRYAMDPDGEEINHEEPEAVGSGRS